MVSSMNNNNTAQSSQTSYYSATNQLPNNLMNNANSGAPKPRRSKRIAAQGRRPPQNVVNLAKSVSKRVRGIVPIVGQKRPAQQLATQNNTKSCGTKSMSYTTKTCWGTATGDDMFDENIEGRQVPVPDTDLRNLLKRRSTGYAFKKRSSDEIHRSIYTSIVSNLVAKSRYREDLARIVPDPTSDDFVYRELYPFLQSQIKQYQLTGMGDYRGTHIDIVLKDVSQLKDLLVLQNLDMHHDFYEKAKDTKQDQLNRILSHADNFIDKLFETHVFQELNSDLVSNSRAKHGPGVDALWARFWKDLHADLKASNSVLTQAMARSVQKSGERVYKVSGWERGFFNTMRKLYAQDASKPRSKRRKYTFPQIPRGSSKMPMVLDMSNFGALRLIYGRYEKILHLSSLADAGQFYLKENDFSNFIFQSFKESLVARSQNLYNNGGRYKGTEEERRIVYQILSTYFVPFRDLVPAGKRLCLTYVFGGLVSIKKHLEKYGGMFNVSVSTLDNLDIVQIMLLDIAKTMDQSAWSRSPTYNNNANMNTTVASNNAIPSLNNSQANGCGAFADFPERLRCEINKYTRNTQGDYLLRQPQKTFALDFQPFSYKIYLARPLARGDTQLILINQVKMEPEPNMSNVKKQSYLDTETINGLSGLHVDSKARVFASIMPEDFANERWYAKLLQKHLGDFVPNLYSIIWQFYYGTGDYMAAASYKFVLNMLRDSLVYRTMYFDCTSNREAFKISQCHMKSSAFVEKLFLEDTTNVATYFEDFNGRENLAKMI